MFQVLFNKPNYSPGNQGKYCTNYRHKSNEDNFHSEAIILREAIKTNKELHAQRDLFDEMGQNLDIQVADQIVEIDNQRIELQGTASEQYYQLRARLKDIYDMESTPMTAL